MELVFFIFRVGLNMGKWIFGLHKTRVCVSTSYCISPVVGYIYGVGNLMTGYELSLEVFPKPYAKTRPLLEEKDVATTYIFCFYIFNVQKEMYVHI